MLQLLLFIFVAGTLVYLLSKLYLCLYRPFILFTTFGKIEQMYNRLLTDAERDVSSAVENLDKWVSGDKAVRTVYTEGIIMERIIAAKAVIAHEEEVYGKFMSLRERFVQDHKELLESIVAYRRYLEVRLKHRQDAKLFASEATSGSMSLDEIIATSKKTMTVLEENERKLDIILAEGRATD